MLCRHKRAKGAFDGADEHMTIPDTMTAIAIEKPGGPEVLVSQMLPVPEPREGEVLIRVHAAGVNRPDVLQRQGGYPPPPGAPPTPGLEVSGTVVALGEGVNQPAPGDSVCALIAGGGYAEYAVARADHTLPLPSGFTHGQAAGLPETFFTVWHNVFQRGGLRSGETLLVHGGASGIGTTAIQLARKKDATVFATAGSAEKCAACEKLGAQKAFNYRETDFVEELRAATDGRGADVILDMVGGDYIERNFDAAAADGRIVQIAFLNGATAQTNFVKLMLKRLTLTGSTLRPRDDTFKAQLAAELRQEVWPLLDAHEIAPIIHATFPLTKARDAHALMEGGSHIGKIILNTG